MLPRAVEITRHALVLVVSLSAPALAAGMIAGLVVGLFSSVTRVQDGLLASLPRLVAVALALALTGAAGASAVVRFTHDLWASIPTLVR